MSVFEDSALKLSGFNETGNLKGKEAISIVGLTPPAKSHFAALACKKFKRQGIYICESDYLAQKICEDISFYLPGKALYYPSKELEFFKADAKSHEAQNMRLEVIEKLLEGEKDTVTVMSVDALLQFTVSFKSYRENQMKICVGDEISLSEISKKLVNMGYSKEDMVEGKGQFSVRGGILDIFPPTLENPARIELFGDEVDSIRSFDVFTQVSIENIEEVKIGPADEMLSHKTNQTSVLEYFSDDALVFFDEPLSISERKDGLIWDIEETVKALAEKDETFEFSEKYIHDYYDVLKELLTHPFVSLSELPHSNRDFRVKAEFSITAGEIGKKSDTREQFYADLKDWQKNGYTVIFSIEKEKCESLKEDLESAGFSVNENTEKTYVKKINFVKGGLKKGFYHENIKTVFYGEEEIFGRTPKKRKKRKKLDSANRIRDFNDLNVGDYVVHRTHGIGQYLGLETLEVEGKRHDYLKVKYSGSDHLYVPCEQLDLLQKYVGKEGVVRLNKMGGADFARQKSKVKESARELARELVALYAKRQAAKGYAFSPDTDWQKSFEDGFPYVETDDQMRSIEEVKRDMESPRPMDRLLC